MSTLWARTVYGADSNHNINARRVLCLNQCDLKVGDRCFVECIVDSKGHSVLCADKTESKVDAYNNTYRNPNGVGIVTEVTLMGDVWVMRDPNPQAVALGSIRTPQKAASSRANIAKAHANRTPAACTCNQEPHRPGCPVYARERQQESRARKLAAQK